MEKSVQPTKPVEPFFVLGSQRSGTTMLRLMLNAHPELAIPHETAFMTVYYRRLVEYGDLSVADNASRLLADIAKHPLIIRGKHITDRDAILAHPISTFSDLIDAIMTEYARSQDKLYWGDKTPFYTEDIDILWQLFPDARFVHLVRDGRDVAISQRDIGWLPSGLPRIAREWRWKTTICHKVGHIIGPKQFLECKYEDLVLDSQSVLSEICEFLGIDYAPEMLAYHKTASKVVPKESLQWHQNSVRAPDPAKVYAWKSVLRQSDRIIFDQIAGPALDLFGYDREDLSSTIGSRLKNLYYNAVVRN